MQNVGEEIAGEYLRICKSCDFIQYNLQNPDIQGEIDVVGISLKENTVYLCEVAIHLITGLQYVDQKTKQTNNVAKLIQKLEKDWKYAAKYFPKYKHVLMVWSPIVKSSRDGAKNNQLKDIDVIQKHFKDKHGIELQFVANQKYWECLQELRGYTLKETKELKSPVLRYLQIEEHLRNRLRINSGRI